MPQLLLLSILISIYIYIYIYKTVSQTLTRYASIMVALDATIERRLASFIQDLGLSLDQAKTAISIREKAKSQ